MNNILDELKYAFQRPNNGLMQIIVINLIIFVALLIIWVPLTMSGVENVYRIIVEQLSLPAALGKFIYRPWTLVTYFFTHEGFFHVLFNLLFLYWFGKIIREFLGDEKVVNLYILGGLVGGIFYILMYNLIPYYQDSVATSQMVGASAGVYAVVVGAATFMPNYSIPLILLGPVRIKYIALFFVIMSYVGSVGSNAGGNLAHLAGAGLGFLFIKQLQKGNDLGKPVTQFLTFVKSFFVRQPKVKVSYRNAKTKNGRPSKSGNSFKTKQEEIDAILDKISASGYDSLTREEKKKLFDASKN
ncbi:MAG: rhomboid family intramembrane serine protease [Cyclobacteriaceae bacterium]